MSISLLLFTTTLSVPPTTVADLKLPPGFRAYVYSDSTLANDIYTMTVDEAGRVIVAGRGYLRLLVDDDGDGRADRAIDLIDGLKDGPMGLLAEGDSLFVVADGGLKRYRGYNGKDKLKGLPEPIYAVKTSGEHEAHAVRRGPDGWLYLMCGNMSGVKKDHLDQQRSPVKDPIAGSLLRISPDFKTIEVVCDGFRNAYGFDFNLEGEPFTFDSDNERCVGLPWYEPCRFYHCVPGGNYGWRSPQLSQTWRKPPYFADVVPPIGTTGRGSPTGVVCYRSTLFPGPYRGNFFIADWTFGKVWFVPLEKNHSSYVGKPEVFLEAIGESGFAPTALAVHPKTGELLVSIGGRGTRGAVYRITHDRGGPATELPTAKRALEWNAEESKQWLKDAVGDDTMKRRHALEMIFRWREKLGWGQFLADAIKPNLSHVDALVRTAAGRAAVGTAAPLGKLDDPLARLTVDLFSANEVPDRALSDALETLEAQNSTLSNKLFATRVLQLALGDLTDPKVYGTIGEGYTFRKTVPRIKAERIYKAVKSLAHSHTAEFEKPRSTPELNREIARIMGGIDYSLQGENFKQHEFVEWMYRRATITSPVEDDIHYLSAMSRMRQESLNRDDGSIAYSLLDLDRKLSDQKVVTDNNWPRRFEELSTLLVLDNEHMTSEILRLARTRSGKVGRPAHLPIIRAMSVSEDHKALLVWRAAQRNDYTWTASTVQAVGRLCATLIRPKLVEIWARGGLEDSVLLVLANEPHPDDGPRFVVGLRSTTLEVVEASAAALNKLEPQRDKADVFGAIIALRKLPNDRGSAATRDTLLALLKDRTGQSHNDAESWAGWFAKSHPDLAAVLNHPDGFDAAAWRKRETTIPWSEGDSVKGRAASIKATCAACHDGGGAIGPSLAGVSKRFSRDDLLTAILQPSKDVSPRYRPTRIITTDGKSYVGMIVYEAVSGIILQTGPDAVIRLSGDQIESQKLLDTSLMPTGLLDKLTDREVADLLTYLRSQ